MSSTAENEKPPFDLAWLFIGLGTVGFVIIALLAHNEDPVAPPGTPSCLYDPNTGRPFPTPCVNHEGKVLE